MIINRCKRSRVDVVGRGESLIQDERPLVVRRDITVQDLRILTSSDGNEKMICWTGHVMLLAYSLNAVIDAVLVSGD